MRWLEDIRGGVIGAFRTGVAQRARPGALWQTARGLRRDRPTTALLIAYHAHNDPHRIAVCEGDRLISFFELGEWLEVVAVGSAAPPAAAEKGAATLVGCLAGARDGSWSRIASALAGLAETERPDRILHVAGAPLESPTSRGLAVMSLLLGRTVVLADPTPEAILGAAARHRATTAHAERATLDAMTSWLAAAEVRPDLSRLETMYTDPAREGGGPSEVRSGVLGDRVVVLAEPRLTALSALAEES